MSRLGEMIGLAGLLLAMSAAPAGAVTKGGTFNGFNDHFNLGQSTATGLVCEANRSFDFGDKLAAAGVKAWDVSCRGWSKTLGRLYLFPKHDQAAAQSLWLADLSTRTDCQVSSAQAAGAAHCKTKPIAGETTGALTFPTALDYVAFAPTDHGRLSAEGVGPVADVLKNGLGFMSGAAREPPAIAEQTADVSQVVNANVVALNEADASSHSAADRLEAGYRGGQGWNFDQAESIFAELATPSADASYSLNTRTEALYNLALNASNGRRFDEAADYFAQADTLAADPSVSASVRNLGLNYHAAHERNLRHYDNAIQIAEKAIAARASSEIEAPVQQTPDGGIHITEEVGGGATSRLNAAQRERLRDVQAREIEATSQEALGHLADAHKTLAVAIETLDEPLDASAPTEGRLTLGDATPWLGTLVRGDLARVDEGSPQEQAALRQYKDAVASFGRKYPGSLPLAGFLIELARLESFEIPKGAERTPLEEASLADFEAAIQIFVRQRGSLGPSADLIQPYFDILIRRITAAPAGDPADIGRFFDASQAIITQSSAEAAKRQAARMMAGSEKTAVLARALDDTNKKIDEKVAEQRQLEQHNAYTGSAKANLDEERSSLLADANRLQLELLQADPNYASALRKSVGLGELQKVLEDGEVYVKVFILADRGYGILVSRTEAKPYVVSLTRDQAQDMVDTLRQPMEDFSSGASDKLADYDVGLAHDLFEKLFGPVHAEVLAASHIIYEPDASLIGAPIDALVVDDASVSAMHDNITRAAQTHKSVNYVGVNWLGAKLTSSIALSTSAFVQVRQQRESQAKRPFFGFGDPIVSDDPRAFHDVQPTGFASDEGRQFCALVRAGLHQLSQLPETAGEVKSIAASFGEAGTGVAIAENFTDNDVLALGQAPDGLQDYKVLYFATHGVLPQPYGCVQSALVTSLGDASSDGLLDLNKIGKLQLDADMVVLAACDTGRGARGDGSEALGGLVTTFVNVGARNVVVSSWGVYSYSTVKLMTSMFADKNVTQSQALAKAERTMMGSTSLYSHPYFWAPFVIVGDGDRPMPSV